MDMDVDEDVSQYAVGIDIGGTKIALGIVDRQGTLHARTEFPTDSPRGIPDACRRIRATLDTLLEPLDVSLGQLGGIGLGCPGPMNRETGQILNPHTLPGWEEPSLTASLGTFVDLPIAIENDADAALLGECFAGSAAGCQHTVMLTFGTGVGGAAVSDGKILRGLEGEHPEIGLIPVLPHAATDYSGVPGSLESLASGTAIAKAGAEAGFPNARAVFQAHQDKDPAAAKIIDKATRAISNACLTIAHMLCPECIILGGGVMDEHYTVFAPPIEAALGRATLLPPGKIKLVRAQLGNLAGIVGAASLCFPPTTPSLANPHA